MDNITLTSQTGPAIGDVGRKKPYHHGNLRAAIIDAVAELIRERRSLDFHLKDIAGVVGTSQAALYRHFTGRRALLVETAIAGYDIQKKIRSENIACAGPHALERIIAMGVAYLRFARDHAGFFMLMKVMETDEILSSEKYCEQRDETLRLIRELIAAAVEEGTLVDEDVDVLMTSLQATASGLASLLMGDQLSVIARDRRSDPELFQKILILHMTGVMTPKGQNLANTVKNKPFCVL
ncbi:MAG: TetR/AcrR family transcriptional regulator [Parvularcula sp.]